MTKPTNRPRGRPPKATQTQTPRPAPGSRESVIDAQQRLDQELDKPTPNRWRLRALETSLQSLTKLYQSAQKAGPGVNPVPPAPAPHPSRFELREDPVTPPILSPEEIEAARKEAEERAKELAESVRVESERKVAERKAETQKEADAALNALNARLKVVEAGIQAFEDDYIDYGPNSRRLTPADTGQPGSSINDTYLKRQAEYEGLKQERETLLKKMKAISPRLE
jgi:hypothetical protein